MVIYMKFCVQRYKNLSSQEILHIFSANFAESYVKNPCNTTVFLRIFSLSSAKLCFESLHKLLVKTGSKINYRRENYG